MKNPLLYPDGKEPMIFDTVRREKNIQNLRLESLVNNIFLGTQFSLSVEELYNLATSDAETINYREDMIRDLISNPQLEEAFFEIPSTLIYLKEYTRKMEFRSSLICQVGLKYRRLSMYAKVMNSLRAAFNNPSVKLTSQAIKHLQALVDKYYDKDKIDEMLNRFKDVDASWLDIRSVNLGVNLKNGSSMVNMVIAEFSPNPYDQSSVFTFWRKGEITGVSNLKSLPNIANAGLFQTQVMDMIHERYKKPINELKSICNRYSADGLKAFEELGEAFSFYAGALNLIRRLRNRGFTMCHPVVKPADRFFIHAKEMYPIDLALDETVNTIKNDINFDPKGKFYILTGANSSGKSTYMTATGQLIWLLQLGYYLPCDYVEIAPSSSIFTIFSGGETDNYEDSRMGEEVRQISEMLPNVTSNSVIIMNEPLTSTSPLEGSMICRDLIKKLLEKKASGVIATHFYELYDLLPEIEEKFPGQTGSIITVTKPDPETDIAIRTYKVKEDAPQKKSYALEVAAVHGVTLRQVVHRLSDRGLKLDVNSDVYKKLHDVDDI